MDPPFASIMQALMLVDTPPVKFRLVTRSDFDGLVCGVLLTELNLIDDILFVHPKDMQDSKVLITANDITTNLPYNPAAHRVFDHHVSETLRNATRAANHVIDPNALSAARVVYDYYGGAERFPRVSADMMAAVDKADSAQFSVEDILRPTNWVLLNYLMDPRTGLGRFRNFRVSNYSLMMDLIQHCATLSIDEILQLTDVRERAELYFEHVAPASKQLQHCSTIHKNLLTLDLRNQDTIFATNRFLIYALYPQANISIHCLNGRDNQNTVFAVGKSIVNRSSKTHIGQLMLSYGGGGHENAGTCQIANADASRVMHELIETINSDG
ncbi:MAG: exopolyphosphatase [Burkholderiaceae bacterium]